LNALPDSSRQLLDAAYTRLGFVDGDLLSAVEEPTDSTALAWVEKGDWLTLASRVQAEKIFFVDNNPVIVFAEQESADPAEWFRSFNSVWCMARPQILFLARPGELAVFNLTKKPARPGEDPIANDRLLDVVRVTADVQDRLFRYRRDQVESGRLFEDVRFGFDDRADRALIRDLEEVRAALIGAGLAPAYAHALIGRSIFIRYLEDRGVLTEAYFRRVAAGDKQKWNAILNTAPEASADLGGGKPVFYTRVLTNKAFTYALFTKLAKDFNGDMFPIDREEQHVVLEKHLRLLRGFLLGGQESNLFFFAYRFDIIPIELISSIYEKFYTLDLQQKKQKRDEGSYYTPSALVDFTLSLTLTNEILETKPRVMDPACGSGIFLVEAFRRIVRHKVNKDRQPLTPETLRGILRDQIAGMDINPEAIRVAAFSLYLAMLHYLKPPNILHHKLPHLTYGARTHKDPRKYLDILLAEDAFCVDDNVPDAEVRSRFGNACADVVVGNPPWGAPVTNVVAELRSDGGIGWCEARGLKVGDKERSQTFIHRTLNLLRPGGRSGMLVSTGVFFKRHQNTKDFRRQWLEQVTVRSVVNFAAVRDAFFRGIGHDGKASGEGSIAPFAAVVFDKAPAPADSRFSYWSAKETAFVKRVQAVVLNRADLRMAKQNEYVEDDTLWKIYWWGGHRDEALISRLRLVPSFKQVVDPDEERMRVGFQEASRKDKADWLRSFMEFPTTAFERYGELPTAKFVKPPTRVHRRRERTIYEGPRILVKRGIDQNLQVGGQIAARYESEPFCFRDSIHCAPASDLGEERAKVLLAILWSSLTRYYLFLTSGTWGLWHDEVKKDVIYSLPVVFPEDAKLTNEIVEAVDSLRTIPDEMEEEGTLFPLEGLPKRDRNALIRELEAKLDQAVYRLFGLGDEERELIEELCGMGLDFFYRGMKSRAVEPLDWPDPRARFGRREDLPSRRDDGIELQQYLTTFVDLWDPHLRDQGGRFRWRIIRPAKATTMLAVIFQTESKNDQHPTPSGSDEQAWVEILNRLGESTRHPTTTRRVFIDGLIRIVTDTDIVIIKRNERRLWSRPSARDDAEATMLMAMQLDPDTGQRGDEDA
jgi:N-6 DNA Methylase